MCQLHLSTLVLETGFHPVGLQSWDLIERDGLVEVADLGEDVEAHALGGAVSDFQLQREAVVFPADVPIELVLDLDRKLSAGEEFGLLLCLLMVLLLLFLVLLLERVSGHEHRVLKMLTRIQLACPTLK
mgnify:CR=1 FL=1